VVALYYAVSRSLYLYMFHLAMVIVMAWFAVAFANMVGSERLIFELNLHPFVYETRDVISRFATMTYLPTYLDILPLYVVLTLFAAALYMAFGMRWQLYLALSAVIYGITQVTGINFPAYPAGTGWFFNPMAWQFVFVAGFIANMVRHKSWAASTRRSAAVAWAAGIMLLVGLFAAAPWAYQSTLSDWRPLNGLFAYADKQFDAPLRLLHFFALVLLGSRLVTRDTAWDRTFVGTVICSIGQRSLRMFIAATFLSVIMRAVLYSTAYTVINQVLVTAVGAVLICAIAMIMKRADRATLEAKKAV